MAALTTMIAAGSLALGAVGSAVQYKQQKDAEDRARREAERQKEEAREAAALKDQQAQDPRLKIGSGDGTSTSGRQTSSAKGTSTRRSQVGVDAGRMFSGPGASQIGGL